VPSRVLTSRASVHRQLRVEIHGVLAGVSAVLDPDDGSGRLSVYKPAAEPRVETFPADAMNIYKLFLEDSRDLVGAPTFADGARAQRLLDDAVNHLRKTART